MGKCGDQLWNSGRQCKIFSRIGNQESAIFDPESSAVKSLWYSSLSSVKCLLSILWLLQKALLHGVVDTLTKGGFVTDSISLGDTKFMVRVHLKAHWDASYGSHKLWHCCICVFYSVTKCAQIGQHRPCCTLSESTVFVTKMSDELYQSKFFNVRGVSFKILR